ncbi:DUF7117 family protein [Halorubrum tibetense]|uniref:TFIIB-type zinc ribbon-containing protein n=1 Tax=Halorubrum tibetense TaxID=175631 RepID=A0ABD5S7I0_9EURY
MNVRGERECRDCGGRWSYYETGTVECPACGSVRSVGVEGRATHTDSPVSLDLAAHRTRFGEARGTLPTDDVDALKHELRTYLRKRGFIDGGELRTLDDTVLAARELLEAVDVYDRRRDPSDADREYLLALLAGAEEGKRPEATEVPESMRVARGAAAARAVSEYRDDLLTFLDELASTPGRDGEPIGGADQHDDIDSSPTVSVSGDEAESRVAPARQLLGRVRDRTKRVDALGGDVAPTAADALVEAVNAVGEYVRTGDGEALDRARSRLADTEA